MKKKIAKFDVFRKTEETIISISYGCLRFREVSDFYQVSVAVEVIL